MTRREIEEGARAFGRSNVTFRIESVRARAGRDPAALKEGADALVSELLAEFPETPAVASYARGILDDYVILARSGLLPPEPDE